MRALILDTETTGLVISHLPDLDKLPEVIEFAAIGADIYKAKVFSTFETLIKPSHYPMDDKTIKETKTKITNEMLIKAPSFAEVADAIRDRIQKADMVIAHNASFDKEMIDIEFERLRKSLDWPKMICTVEQTMFLKGHRLNLSLLYTELFEEDFENAHRAMADVKALTRISFEMAKRRWL